MSKKVPITTTDIFKDKVIPAVISGHPLFKTPRAFTKVFPSIGLSNFKDKASIEKCLKDIKKDGSYVFMLFVSMVDIVNRSQIELLQQVDVLQFLSAKEVREQQQEKINEIFEFSNILSSLKNLLDPYQPENLNESIDLSTGKISLKLSQSIKNNKEKVVFKKGESLFTIFNKIKDRSAKLGANKTIPLDQTNQFKIFSKENLPNKEFSIVFSSDGAEGAWDILTMSMRGIRSCQGWTNDYPKCLVGAVYSKFVGIIYLTSGALSEDFPPYIKLGTKMMRRCIIRYAIDDSNKKPVILLDKMYPDLDNDILKLFTDAISARTKLPVLYFDSRTSPLAMVKNLYVPHEQFKHDFALRDLSYQDSPLKSESDMKVLNLIDRGKDYEKYEKNFRANLAFKIAAEISDIWYKRSAIYDVELKNLLFSLKGHFNSDIDFANYVVEYILRGILYLKYNSSAMQGSNHYKEFLSLFFKERLKIRKHTEKDMTTWFNGMGIKTSKEFFDWLLIIVNNFVKSELKKTFSGAV